MERIIEIKVDEEIYLEVENLAKSSNSTVSELFVDYALSLSRKRKTTKGPFDIKTYDDLVEALEDSEVSIQQGRVVSEEIGMAKIRQLAGITNV